MKCGFLYCQLCRPNAHVFAEGLLQISRTVFCVGCISLVRRHFLQIEHETETVVHVNHLVHRNRADALRQE